MNTRRAIFAMFLWAAAAAPSLAITYATLDFPGSNYTVANAISGNNVVGNYNDSSSGHGFLYNGSTYTTLDYPGGNGTEAEGLSGSKIVGGYTTSTFVNLGFLYDGSTWTTLDDPLAGNPFRTTAFGISGNTIVGTYFPTGDPTLGRGFLYNGTTYTTLNDPLGTKGTFAQGINGNNIVGFYTDSAGNNHGFLYDGASYTTLDDPLAAGPLGTAAIGISGNNIVGQYTDASGNYHGFLATVPEPSTFALAVLGFGGLIVKAGPMHRRSDTRIGRQRNRGRSFRA